MSHDLQLKNSGPVYMTISCRLGKPEGTDSQMSSSRSGQTCCSSDFHLEFYSSNEALAVFLIRQFQYWITVLGSSTIFFFVCALFLLHNSLASKLLAMWLCLHCMLSDFPNSECNCPAPTTVPCKE